MTSSELAAQIDAASAYESLFVPALFGQWAPLVLQAADVGPGDRILDVACGTGVLARAAESFVGAEGQVTGLDITPGMLEVAKRAAPAINWQQGSAEDLPFDDESFDAVVSQFGLMFFPDQTKSLREMLRVLNAGRRLAVAVWDSLENIPAIAAEVDLLEAIAGSDAADALRTPFTLGDKNRITELMNDAGISGGKITTHKGAARFPNIRTLVEADLRGWLPVMGVILDESVIQKTLDAAEDAIRPHTTHDVEAVFEISAHLLAGSKA